MVASWYIVGCGYVGTRLARRLKGQSLEVLATRQSESGCDLLRQSVAGLQTQCLVLGESELRVGEPAVVVLSAPPGPESPAPELAFARTLPDSARLIYLSTTGVYAPGQGEEVADDYAIAPGSARGQARLDVEAAIRGAHGESVCLRIPAIYGPQRGVHQRMRRGDYRLIGAADTLVGRIHVDDLVSAILLLGGAEELPHREYIIADDAPTSSREHALGVAEMLGLPEPPTVDPSTVSAAVRTMLGADRQIVPRRLRALGWRAQYPSWREGLSQALAEEGTGSSGQEL
jgi:nucleoside-diphosphate-sugar epimerase